MGKSKRVFFVMCVAALSSVFFLFGRLEADERPGHILKEGGKVSCEIVVSDEAGSVALFSGKELQKFLSMSLGSEIPLVKAPSGQKTALILGDSKQLRAAGVDLKKLPRDGFVIKSVGDSIFIAGRDSMDVVPEQKRVWNQLYERGTLFGTYEFLERFVGVRFYFPGELGTIVPKLDVLKIAQSDIFEKPDFEVRKVLLDGSGTGTVDWVPNGKDEKLLARFRLRLETKYIPNCHGLARLGYMERFKESHPEYFALLPDGSRYNDGSKPHPGQLCLSSGIRDEIYKDAEAYLTGKPASSRNIMTKYGVIWDPSGFQPGYFNIMPQDSFYKCTCEKCQSHFSKGPQATADFIWGMVIEVSEKLRENNVPGHLTMMAYTPYRMLPTMQIPDNVMVMVATGGPWQMEKGDCFNWELDLVKSWTEKMHGNKPWLWNYACKFAKLAIRNVPGSTPRSIGEYYKKMSPHIIGAFMESEAESEEIGNYMFTYLNHYVFGKVAWKNSTDVDALLKEHHRLMFGAAAPQMEQVFNAFEEKWLKITGKPIDTPLGPQSIALSDYDIWEKIYSEKEIARLEGLFNESLKIVAGDTESGARVKFIRERFIEPLKKQRQEYEKNQAVINDLRFRMKMLPAGAVIKIDGKLDDAEWKDAAQISLVPYAAQKSKKETGIRTTVKVLRDAENLYFAFDCEEPEMDKLVSSKRKPDNTEIWTDSSVEIFLNPSCDRNVYYQLLMNADGSLSDLSGTKEGGKADWKWNSGATAAAFKGATAWAVEVKIPLINLPGLDFEKEMPANFNRSRVLAKATAEHAALFTWSPFLRGGFNDIDNFGYMIFKDVKSANVIKNSSFTGTPVGRFFDGWYFVDKKDLKAFESWEIIAEPFTESGKCVKLARTSSETGSFNVTQYLPELKPDTEYLLSYSVKVDGMKLLPGSKSTGAGIKIRDDKNNWYPKSFYTSDMPWSRQGFQIKTGPETNKPPHKSSITLMIMDAACSVCFGDVKLVEITKDKKL